MRPGPTDEHPGTGVVIVTGFILGLAAGAYVYEKVLDSAYFQLGLTIAMVAVLIATVAIALQMMGGRSHA